MMAFPLSGLMRLWGRRRHTSQFLLWLSLASLLLIVEALLLWLLLRYQGSQELKRTEDVMNVIGDEVIRILKHDLQETQAMAWEERASTAWRASAVELLKTHRHLQRLEHRDPAGVLLAVVESPYGPPLFNAIGRSNQQRETLEACFSALSPGPPVYSSSYFVLTGRGLGIEVVDLCVTERVSGKPVGFIVATMGLGKLLEGAMSKDLAQAFEVSFIQGDGTRLARAGESRGAKTYRAERLLSVPGLSLQLRVESIHNAPVFEANFVTGLVALVTLAVMSVIWLLVRDLRKRSQLADMARHHQDRLQAAARLATMGEMASLISHEINQPLHTISIYADAALHLAGEEPSAPLQIRHLLQRIAEQAERGGRVVKSVQAFVRRGDDEREELSVGELMESVLPLVELQAKMTQTQLVIAFGRKPPKVVCNRVMVEQVLLNLARNAMQAMDSSPAGVERALRIAASQQDSGRVQFTITDTGPGISPDAVEQLYTRFMSKKNDGMGLGLSLCRSVVEKHGGVFEITNFSTTDSGKSLSGVKVTFTLPGLSSVNDSMPSSEIETAPLSTNPNEVM